LGFGFGGVEGETGVVGVPVITAALLDAGEEGESAGVGGVKWKPAVVIMPVSSFFASATPSASRQPCSSTAAVVSPAAS
jgi:hypothetical protein